MKKIGIFTIQDNDNYGNRLQNYALQKVLIDLGFECYSFKNYRRTNFKSNTLKNLILQVSLMFNQFLKNLKNRKRYKYFKEFNKNISFYKKNITYSNYIKEFNKFDYIIVGSDQVWNYNMLRLSNIDLLENIDKEKSLSYAASFGVDEIPAGLKEKVKKLLEDFKFISVREMKGKEIVNELLPLKSVEVLLDPTMLVEQNHWLEKMKKPKKFYQKRYILNYFLGKIRPEIQKVIDSLAKEYNCEIVSILDSNLYNSGPSEFLYLEKNAFLICTDSFHSSVFAIIFQRPFIVFDREDKIMKISSRIDTLLQKFKLEDRKYNGKIPKNLFDYKYDQVLEILNNEKKRAIDCLMKNL